MSRLSNLIRRSARTNDYNAYMGSGAEDGYYEMGGKTAMDYPYPLPLAEYPHVGKRCKAYQPKVCKPGKVGAKPGGTGKRRCLEYDNYRCSSYDAHRPNYRPPRARVGRGGCNTDGLIGGKRYVYKDNLGVKHLRETFEPISRKRREGSARGASKSKWIQWVKDFARGNRIPYGVALSNPMVADEYHLAVAEGRI